MRTFVILMIGLAAPAAYPQEGMYVGLGAGAFDYEQNVGDGIFGALAETGSAYKLFGGFEFTDNFGAEISYGKTVNLDSMRRGSVAPIGDYVGFTDYEFSSTALKAVGQLPREWGALIGGLGFFSIDADLTRGLDAACCVPETRGFSITDDGMLAMLGIEWRFGRFGTGYGVRLEYEWWDLDGADASSLGLGLSFRF